MLLGVLAAPAAAQAGTAAGSTYRVETCNGGDECRYFAPFTMLRVLFTAAPGERNAVSAEELFGQPDGAAVVLRDEANDVKASGLCKQQGPRGVRCAGPYQLDAEVRTGDQDDTVTRTGEAYMGTGNDTASGLDNGSSLFGEQGNDTVTGGAGIDLLYGGDGDDRLRGLVDSDYMYGGAGRDRLGGDADDDTLKGDGGRDRVSGGPGADELSGGDGDDRMSGGSGSSLRPGPRSGARRPHRRSDRLRSGQPPVSL